MAYIAPDGRLCQTTDFLDFTSGVTPVLSETYSSRLRTCAQKRDYPALSVNIFLNHRYTINTGDPERVLTTGKDFVSYLHQSFLSSSFVSTSRIYPFNKALPIALPFSISSTDYTRLRDTLPAKLTTLSKNLKQPLADKLVILSPLVSYPSATSQDTIILYYLQGSVQSKILAEALEQSLRSLQGKVYFHNQQLQDTPDNTVYKLDFTLRLEPLDVEQAAKQGLFLAQSTLEQSHPTFYKERLDIPAVFIDFVDNTNKFTLLDNHLLAFADALTLGFQRYLEQLPKSSAPKNEPGSIWTNPTNP